MTDRSFTLRAAAPGGALLLAALLLPTGAAAADETFDACRLLKSAEIQAVQGEGVAHAKASSRASQGLLRAQCYYTLATATSSVSLQVTLPEPGARAPKSPLGRWRAVFHARAEERGQEADSDPPASVSGLGDEAFWVSDRVVGVLYVLEGDAFFRISVGGAEGEDVKREKSEALARDVLARL